MEIVIDNAERFQFDAEQQKWNNESDSSYQRALFSGHEMMAWQSDNDPKIYELRFLGLMISGFKSMDDAKSNAPQFAKDVFHHLSEMISN